MWCNPYGKACCDCGDFECSALEAAEDRVDELTEVLRDVLHSATLLELSDELCSRLRVLDDPSTTVRPIQQPGLKFDLMPSG